MENLTPVVAAFSLSSVHTVAGDTSNDSVEHQTVPPVVENQPPLFYFNVSKRVLGRSRYSCCCILTNDWSHSFCAASIIVAGVIVFMVCVLPRGEVYSYVIASFLSVSSLLSLMLSVTIDPGILLPLPPDPERRSMVVTVNGREILCKLCPTCHIVRPPRSTHCGTCDYCVDEFDHHCALLGSCVAKRTFRFFSFFLFFTTILALYVGVRSLGVIATIQYELSWGSGRRRWAFAAALICLLLAVLSCFLLVPLTVYYICLACSNNTQKEHGRGRGLCEPDPAFHKGYYRNFFFRYFGPLGKSRLNKEDANRFV